MNSATADHYNLVAADSNLAPRQDVVDARTSGSRQVGAFDVPPVPLVARKRKPSMEGSPSCAPSWKVYEEKSKTENDDTSKAWPDGQKPAPRKARPALGGGGPPPRLHWAVNGTSPPFMRLGGFTRVVWCDGVGSSYTFPCNDFAKTGGFERITTGGAFCCLPSLTE